MALYLDFMEAHHVIGTLSYEMELGIYQIRI